MTYTVFVEATYPSDADATFREALDLAEMQEAMRGLAVYHGLPQRNILEGDTIIVDVTLFKLFTTKNHMMHVERLDPEARIIQSRERNSRIDRWDHMLNIQPTTTGCVWRDRVTLDAGISTFLTARFCRFIYVRRHRMRKARNIRSLIMRGDCTA